MDPVDSFFNNTTTQFYVILTGTSSLLSGLIMVLEWLHFTYFGLSIIDRLTTLVTNLTPFPLRWRKEDPSIKQKKLSEAKPFCNSLSLFRGAELYRYQKETGKIVLTQYDMELSTVDFRNLFTLEGMKVKLDEEDENSVAAEELMESVWSEKDVTERIEMAHRALEMKATCVPALVLLAEEEAASIVEVEELYKQALKAAEGALRQAILASQQDPLFKPLQEHNANICAFCKLRLAVCTRKLGKLKEAGKYYRDLLKDNHAIAQANIHENYVECLLEAQSYSDLYQFLNKQEEAMLYKSTVICYTLALLKAKAVGDKFSADFLSRRGPTPTEVAAFDAIHRAVELNPHVPKYLLELKALIPPSEHIVKRGDSEAIMYAFHHLVHWKRVDGALPLLATMWESTFQQIPFPLERGHLFPAYPSYVEVADREILPPYHEMSVYPQRETPFFMVFTGVLCFSFMTLTVVAYHFPRAMTQYAKIVTTIFLAVLDKILPRGILASL